MSKCILTDRSGSAQDSTKNSLLNQAARLFIIKGYHGTSISDITDACDLTKSSFFHHFASKETIALAVVAFMQRYCEANIFTALHDQTLSKHQKVEFFINNIKIHLFNKTIHSPLIGFVGVELIDALASIKLAIQDYFKGWLKSIHLAAAPFCSKSELPNLANSTLIYLQGSLTIQRIYPNTPLVDQTCQYLSRLWTGKQLTEVLAN